MRQGARLNIRIHMEVSDQPMKLFENDSRERYVKFDFECRRGQHHATDFGGVIMSPGREQNTPDTLPQNRDILYRDSVGAGHVSNKRVDILFQRAKRRTAI